MYLYENDLKSKKGSEKILKEMITYAISDKDYYLFSLFYQKLNLFSNSIIEQKASSTVYLSDDIEDTIYELIGDISIQEMVYNNNTDIRNIIVSYIEDKKLPIVTTVKNDIGKNKTISFQNIVKRNINSLNNKVNSYFMTYCICNVPIELQNENEIFDLVNSFDIMGSDLDIGNTVTTTKQKLEAVWKIEDLSKSKLFNRFVNRQKNTLLEFAGLDDIKELADVLDILFYFTNEKRYPTEIIHENFLLQNYVIYENLICSIFDKYNFSYNLIATYHIPITVSYLNEIIFDMCVEMIYHEWLSDKTLEISQIMRRFEPSDLEYFWVEFISLIVIDAISSTLKAALNAYYKNFSFDKVTKQDTIQEMSKELSEKADTILKLEHSKKVLNEKVFSLQEIISKQTQHEERPFFEEINKLNKKVDSLEEENNDLKLKLQYQLEYINLLEKPEEIISEDIQINKEELYNKKILFIGGRIEIVRELKKLFPLGVFTSNENDNVNMSNVDSIVMFPKFMNHSLYYKYVNLARQTKMQIIYCNMNNLEQVLKKISISL